MWKRCTQTLGAGGAWIPASVYLPKKTGWAGFVLQEPPSTDAFLPLPFLAPTLCPHGGGEQSAPQVEDCPVEATGVHGHPRGRAGGGGGLTASGRGPREHFAQAFYTLQCNFFILFYSDYGYSGILSLR